MPNDNLIIHQSLHGYDRGHRLITSSIQLSSEGEQTTLYLSDLSGQRMIKGFEEYLTGYPLETDQYYAFSKTWYAEEMPRPGCVWTHTFYIPFNQIHLISHLLLFDKFFIRPNSENVEKYKNQLTLVIDNDKESDSEYNLELLLYQSELINKFYHYSQPCIFRSSSSKKYEKLIIDFYSIQWPYLKRKLSFSTGSINPRFIDKKPFDIQVTPISSQIVESKDYLYIDAQNSGTNNIALLFNNSDFKKFLNYVITDPIYDKSMFFVFADIYIRIQEYKKLSLFDKQVTLLKEILKIVADNFEEPESGKELKTKLFGIGNNYQFDEYQLLLLLCTTEDYSTLNNEQIALNSRILNYFDKNYYSALQLVYKIIDYDFNPLFESILPEINTYLSENDLKDILIKRKQLLFAFLPTNPKIALDYSIWQIYEQQSDEIITILSKNLIDDKLWEEIIKIVIKNRIKIDVTKTYEKIGEKLIKCILDSLNEIGESYIYDDWKNILIQRQDLIIDWLIKNHIDKRNLLNIIKLLNPNYEYISAIPSNIWISLFDPETVTNEYCGFLMAVSFNNYYSDSAYIASLVFEKVHQVLRFELLPTQIWENIAYHLPDLGHKNWDKCERLRIGFINYFITGRWQSKYLFDAVNDYDLFSKLIKITSKSFSGERYFEKLLRDTNSGRYEIKIFQKQILDRNTSWLSNFF